MQDRKLWGREVLYVGRQVWEEIDAQNLLGEITRKSVKNTWFHVLESLQVSQINVSLVCQVKAQLQQKSKSMHQGINRLATHKLPQLAKAPCSVKDIHIPLGCGAGA